MAALIKRVFAKNCNGFACVFMATLFGFYPLYTVLNVAVFLLLTALNLLFHMGHYNCVSIKSAALLAWDLVMLSCMSRLAFLFMQTGMPWMASAGAIGVCACAVFFVDASEFLEEWR